MIRRLVLALFVCWALVVGACSGDDAPSEQSLPPVATTQPTPTEEPAPVAESPTVVSTPTPVPDERQPVVIDTDLSVEGAMAILYLLQQPDLRVDAITIAGTGLVSCRAGVEQALGLVALADHDVPVACGPTEPLSGDNSFPSSFRSTANSLSGVLLPRGGEPSQLSAPELLASVIESSAVPVVIYADGPLTNVALMLDAEPDLVDNVAGITVMGGAVDVPGNTFDNPSAEWNIWVDPVAADHVLGSGAPITLVPLDATNAVPLTVLHTRVLERHQSTPIAETTFKLVRGISGLGEGFIYMWDQLNAAVLVDDSVVTLEPRSIAVTTEGGPDVVGSIVADADGAEVRVAVDADRIAFERHFLSTLLGEPVDAVDLSPEVTVGFDGETWTHDIPDTWPLGTMVVSVENSSDQAAAVVVGWLLGDATLEDLEAWTSIDQPPFFEVAGFVGADPNSSTFSVLEFTEPGLNIAAAITLAPESVTTLATLDID